MSFYHKAIVDDYRKIINLTTLKLRYRLLKIIT